MKKVILLGTAIILLAASCKKDQGSLVNNSGNLSKSSAKVCVDKGFKTDSGQPTTESIFVKTRKWGKGQIIRVKFLNGSSFLRSKVKQYAIVWEKYANIKFSFVTSGPAEIKVGFKLDGDEGSW